MYGDAYVGADCMLPVPGPGIEISGGKQAKAIGNSFILSGGGTNGNERGPLTLAFSFPMAGIRDLVTDYKDRIGGIAGLIIRY